MDQFGEKLVFSTDSQPPNEVPGGNIDLLNDETFGSGAVESGWEDEHYQFAEKHTSRNGSLGGVSKPLDEDELELSNQQLAAAVEELVLNSDQDQDAIDPAIVSLRKESRPGSYDPRLTENLISPYMGERSNFGRSTPTYSTQPSSVFQSDGMRNIWSNSDLEVQDSFAKSPSMILERQALNDKLKKMLTKSSPAPEFEDEAILTAVKAASSSSGNWPVTSQEDILRQMFPHNPPMLRAEDLEREFSKSDLRGPSPTFGISIPKDTGTNQNGVDRSLPARSVSPVIGSPTSPLTLPIGTPPKHITDMIQQAHKQGVGMVPPRPGQPVMPVRLQRPPQGFVMPQGRNMPPPGPMGPLHPWPPGMIRPPMNPLVAQDIINKMGINKSVPMMVGSPPANMSPIGSPRFVQAPHLLPQPNIGFGPAVVRPGQIPMGFRGPRPPMGHFPNQRFMRPPPPRMYLGPGHLHPEHSRFVRMRRQQSSHGHPYNNHHHRPHGHNGFRDPHSNLMTNREKEWVVRIQMMALQSDRPEIDDYYYQHFIEKRLREGRLSLDNESSEQKRLITPTKTNPDHKKYIPVQFENSLGKLTASSVYNPRQIIDVIHAEKDEEMATETIDAKMSMNKRLEIYKVIEKGFSALLRLEEIQFRAENGHHSDHESDEDPRYSDKKQSYITEIEDCLFPKDSTETISQALRIRKGKRLICRVLPHISLKSSLKVTISLLKQLPVLIKRDLKENILQEFYNPISEVLKQSSFDELMDVCSVLVPLCNVICRDKFGFTIMCKLLTVVNEGSKPNEKPPTEVKIWEQFVSSCFKAFLSFAGKKKTSVPSLLESGLDSKVMLVVESTKFFSTTEDKREKQLKDLKELFQRETDLQTDALCL